MLNLVSSIFLTDNCINCVEIIVRDEYRGDTKHDPARKSPKSLLMVPSTKISTFLLEVFLSRRSCQIAGNRVRLVVEALEGAVLSVPGVVAAAPG